MKILFTADIHLKLGQKNVPVDWAKNRYREFFKQVYDLESKVDLHIIGGDIFDRVPTMPELELYFEYIKEVKVRTLLYAGNHEAVKKGQSFFSHLKQVTNAINPLVTIIDEIYEEPEFTIVPYEFIHTKGIWANLRKNVPLFTHVRGEIPPHVKPEIDLTLLQDFCVVFAGDLHSHTNTQRNIVYPGSPMTTSFHRKFVNTGYLIIDGCDWIWKPFKLPQLIRKTVTNPDDMVPTDYDHTIYEIEGDVVDLANIQDTELLDKKLVRRASETSLVLNKDMSIGEELVEYLLYVMEIPEDKVPEILGVFNDHFKDASLG